MSLAELGSQLRAAGLTPRALAAWAGTDRIPSLDVAALVAKEPVPAAIALSLFVAGRDLELDRARSLPLDALFAHELAVEDHGRVHAEVAILPVAQSLVVCDRADAAPTTERVCWPDDSSYHLVSSIPHAARVESWFDLGCGSGFAPLAHPEHAQHIVGIELNGLAIEMARWGAALSHVQHFEVEHGDLAIDYPPVDLVTCNAPMPPAATRDSRESGIEMWRNTDDELFERLFRVLPDRIAPGGLAVVHAAISAIPFERLGGDKRLVIYTPEDVAPAFGVLWWRPHATPDFSSQTYRPLTVDRPHIDAADFRA